MCRRYSLVDRVPIVAMIGRLMGNSPAPNTPSASDSAMWWRKSKIERISILMNEKLRSASEQSEVTALENNEFESQ